MPWNRGGSVQYGVSLTMPFFNSHTHTRTHTHHLLPVESQMARSDFYQAMFAMFSFARHINVSSSAHHQHHAHLFTTTRSLLSERQRQMKPISSLQGETCHLLQYYWFEGNRRRHGCQNGGGLTWHAGRKPVKWPSGCSHMDWVLHDIWI